MPDGVKQRIVLGMKNGTEEDAERLFVFLAASHDLGKATPAFATKECGYCELDERIFHQITDTGLLLEQRGFFPYRAKTPHALASQVLLREVGCPTSIAVILGAHHGRPPDLQMLEDNYVIHYHNYYVNKEGKAGWVAVQLELVRYALHRSGYGSVTELPELDIAAQVLLSGMLVVADWIASDPALFPYVRLDDPAMPDSRQRAATAWDKLELNFPWEAGNRWMSTDLYSKRFGIPSPYPVQKTVRQVLDGVHKPGIIVIEAPMGAGKTEAALVAAEILADKTRRRGVYFALPTQATSDGIFPRMLKWVSRLDADQAQSVRLMHGKAQLNRTFQNLANGSNVGVDEETDVFVHEWFTGRKRAMLDDFVVGTIDQLLLAALKQKHVMLRHLGLANKVVIVDECHAFDAYMNCYLERALNWLGAYGVPVVVLSATLPAEKRKLVIEAYLGKSFQTAERRTVKNPFDSQPRDAKSGQSNPQESLDWLTNRSYPLVTYTDGLGVRQVDAPCGPPRQPVDIAWLDDESITQKLGELLSDGGCAGVIVNTVSRAQTLAHQLSDKFGADVVLLLHSRFLAPDRIAREEMLTKELGRPDYGRTRPHLRIVVGTQVLEQSLDIDFDVLITDLCPIDLLLQRIGRLHRHDRRRPLKVRRPVCFVTNPGEGAFDEASVKIYSEYLLMRTRARLPNRVKLPEDIPALVQDVYDAHFALVPETENYQRAENEYNHLTGNKRDRAEAFRMRSPKGMSDMIDWLDTYVSDKNGESSVRDTEDSIEVLLVRSTSSGNVSFLPWIEEGMELERYREPPAEIARKLACCSVRLPVAVSGRFKELDATIRRLEEVNQKTLGAWQQSPWLSGEVFLILDEDLSAEFGKFRLNYHPDYGLDYTVKEEKTESEDRQTGV